MYFYMYLVLFQDCTSGQNCHQCYLNADKNDVNIYLIDWKIYRKINFDMKETIFSTPLH